MVVESIMLEKISVKAGETEQRKCSDCGCHFNPPEAEATISKSQPSAATPRHRQRRLHKAKGPSKCPSCARLAPSSGRRLHRRAFRPDPHSCPLCTKTFISSAHLALHLPSHKERKYRCAICGKLFIQASHMMAHKLIHSGDRPFKCPECGKTFGRASHLKTHSRLHTGEKPFKCSFCAKAFAQKAGLVAHLRLHTGERPHKCEQCGVSFCSLSSLLSHKAEEESSKQSQSLPVPAPDPPQETQANMEDLKCGVCCRTFVRSSYVRLYMRLNRGQRPYHCKVCNKTFAKMNTFVNHCDKHLKQRRAKPEKVEEKVVKPPSFVPLSRPSSPQSLSTVRVSSEVSTRSRTRARGKLET